MGYFDSEQNVDAYLSMVESYDGAPLMAQLVERLPQGSRVLEIGMGGGADLDLLLDAGFDATGSDASVVFLEKYRKRGGAAPTVCLDARTLETELRFDAVFSNKVLQHLTREETFASLGRQAQLVEPGGLLIHTLWSGEGEDQHHGLLFTKYTKETLGDVMPSSLELVECKTYMEMSADDSLLVVLRRKG